MAPISDIERQAFTDIYETYSGKLYGVCLHYVNDRETAEDLLHDSFIVIFSSLDSLRDPSRLEQWMSSIVRNIAFQHLKKTRRMPQTSIEEIPEPVMEDSSVHYTEIPLDELLAAVDSLPEQYGNVFKLSVLEGLSHKEIGAILGIAPHSSSSNLARAKQMLRKVVSKNWGILLTFCLCIVATLFMLKPKTSGPIMADIDEIHLLPAGESELLITEIRKAEALRPLAGRSVREEAVSEEAEVKVEGISETDTETEAKTEIETAPEESCVTYHEHNDIFDEPSEKRERSGSLRFGLDGNFGRSADGKTRTYFPTSSPGQPGYSGSTYPPFTGNDFTSSIQPGNPNPPDGGHEQGGTSNPGDGYETGSPNKVTKFRHAMPVSLNASVTCSFADRWMLTSGLRYTYLHSDMINITDDEVYDQDIHYLGIPVKLSWTFWKSHHIKSYVSAGAAFEFPLYGHIAGKRLDAPCQWSAGLGIGIQYDITPHIGIYIEPEVNRYFDNGSEIQTIRSERPLTLTLPVGIRFSL